MRARGRSRRGGHLRLGRRGERCAARWLKRRGYRILHRNLALAGGEVDLVAEAPDGLTVVLVEVKTRASAWPPPRRALGGAKRRRLAVLAAAARRDPRFRGRPVRIEGITVVWPAGGPPIVRHRSAFASPDEPLV